MAAAAAAKEKGNLAYKAGDFAAAVGHYSSAMFADRTDPTYPLNRAAAYLKLGKFEDAERDCTTVLALSKINVKGLFRRAQARISLNKFHEAKADLREAVRLEPNNGAVKDELEKLSKVRPSSSSPNTSKSSFLPKRVRVPIDVVDATPSSSSSSGPSNSKPRRRRIPIEIVDDTANENPLYSSVKSSTNASRNSSSSPESRAAVAPDVLLTPVSTRSINGSSSSKMTGEIPTAATAPLKRTVGGGIFRPSGSSLEGTPKPASKVFNASAIVGDSNASSSSPDPLHARRPHDNPRPNARPAPTTLFEYTKEWNAATSHMEKWEIISSLPPSAIKPLFGISLTSAILMSIVETLEAVLTPSLGSSPPSGAGTVPKSSVRTYVTSLSSIERFSFVIMFLSETERAKVRSLLSDVGVAKSGWGL
ncbi:hypothetical protein BS47DRAFT_1327509 [Hydnum rufescens UP504]|uniref:RNA polymerase II-associated protein 3 n=1 Tax=Hydnum rufescens UP504 TaxID=1448309 RepID=A0A9P6B2T9_9AGAM|nr:hypothetical protein BS47DRAFT_1327509 [Hydnum rufescens UP504]